VCLFLLVYSLCFHPFDMCFFSSSVIVDKEECQCVCVFVFRGARPHACAGEKGEIEKAVCVW